MKYILKGVLLAFLIGAWSTTNIPGIIIIAYILSKMVKKKEIEEKGKDLSS